MRGVPTAKSTTCLTNQEEVNKLVQMNSDTTSNYPDFKGTPTFILNGEMVDLGPVTEAEMWPALENRLKQAIGG
jgi:protein-disulfide isomerase